jgi:hypothetical protein
MSAKRTAVFGIYPNVTRAEGAVDALVLGRFAKDDVSVLMSDNRGSKDFAHEKHTKAPEGTTTGAATGGAIDGTLGLLAGIGALAIPGAGPLIAAGPIMATSSAWAFPSTRRSDTKGGSKTAACCCPSTAAHPTRSREPRRS